MNKQSPLKSLMAEKVTGKHTDTYVEGNSGQISAVSRTVVEKVSI